MTLLQRVAKLFGCPILSVGDLRAVVEKRREHAQKKAEVTSEANDVFRDFVHGINEDTQRNIIKRGH